MGGGGGGGDAWVGPEDEEDEWNGWRIREQEESA